MNTVEIKHLLSTKAIKNWEGYNFPIAVTDEKGTLYLIVKKDYSFEAEGNVDYHEGTDYMMINLYNGETAASEFDSVRELVEVVEREGNLKLTPVKLDIIIKEYLEVN